MALDITRHAIEKNRITTVALLLIIVWGAGAYRTMPRNEDPGFIIRTALVMTYFPGASPERVEQLVTDKLEKAIQEMPEIDSIVSESKTGVSLVFVNILESYTDMRPIWDDLRRKVDRVRGDLPQGVYGPFVNDEFGDVFGIVITLTGDLGPDGEPYNYAELKEIADEVRDELLLIDQAAKVEIAGIQEERVFLEYNSAKLAELGLSPYQVASSLDQQNIVIPGGQLNLGSERIVLEPSGNFESLEQIRRNVIKLPGRTELFYLEDIAHIHRGYIDPPSSKTRSSGLPCLVLSVNLREGGNIIDLGREVKATMARLEASYPVDINFDVVAFLPDTVQAKVTEFTSNLLQAVGIVVLVMMVTLGLRTGLVVAALIPMAIVMALMVMSLLDIGLDQVSLASLIIALGMLVDNAIVMSESIMVQISRGKKAMDAAADSARELRIPLLTSTLTTAAAFLPIYLAESAVGEYCAPLFKVVTITLLCSWLLALTMTPLLCVTFLRPKASSRESYESAFYRAYRRLLRAMLRHRAVTLVVTTLVFIGAMQGFRIVPQIFFPSSDKAICTADLEWPIGTPIELTEQRVKEIEAYIERELVVNDERNEGVTNWAAFIGSGAPRFVLGYTPEQVAPEFAMLLINATSNQYVVDTLIPKLEHFCRDYPDLVPKIRLLPMGAPVDSPVEVRISGRDTDKVFEITEQVKEHLATIPGVKDIKDNWGRPTKKLLVNVDQARARMAGLTSQDIAVSLQTALSGLEMTQYREQDEVIPVILRTVATQRESITKLETHQIHSLTTGQSVPLKQVADLEVVWEPANIIRRDRLRTVTVQANVEGSVTPIAIAQQMDAWLNEQNRAWGIGYRYELGGEVESSGEANQSIGDKLPIAGLIILLLLVGQFNSLRRPLIIIITIPLGLIGVVFGLIVGRSYFGFMTLLGVVSLAGIVINNAIVLLDRIRIEIETNGLVPQQAIIEAAQRRLRPILLTTATTICGLLPLWLHGGPMWQPMAIAIIFGLAFATVLTLGIVPVLYAVLFRVQFHD